MRNRDGNGQSVANGSDIGGRRSFRDLLRRQQHADGDRRFRHDLRLVYWKLRWNSCRNGNVDNSQPDFHNDILRPLGE